MKKVLSQMAYENTKRTIRVLETLLEISILTLVYYVTWRQGYDPSKFAYKGKYVLMGIYAVLVYAFFRNSECFKFGQLQRGDLVIGQTIALFLVNIITYFQLCLISNKIESALPMLLLFLVQVLISMVLIFIYTELYYKLYSPHDMLLIYGNKRGVALKFKMDKRLDKYNISKLISIDEGLEKVYSEILNHDSVILTDVPADIRNDILKYCYSYQRRAYVAPELTDIMIRGAIQNTLFDTPLLLVKGSGLSPAQRVLKRTTDIVLSAVALVFLAIPMGIIALLIKLEDGGPVFYRQDRLTRYGREFQILKFRSMVVDAEKYVGAVLASEDDPRITKIGKFLRKTRFDELPQLINIFIGDMSLVGPRPERKILADEYAKEIPEFSYRLKVKGGLTGYAQVYGKYNTGAYDKLRFDLMYIENYSLLLDIKLILMTLRIIFSKDSTEGFDKAKTNCDLSENILSEHEHVSV